MKVTICSILNMTKRLLIRVSIVTSVSVICHTTPAIARDLGFIPSIAASEEVNDNIYEVSGIRRTDFITQVTPGFTSRYNSPIWNWDAAYTLTYRNYARKSTGDEFANDASLKGSISVLENFLYLDVGDAYHRVSADIARDLTAQSSLFLNQTNQNIATISPYLAWRLGEKSTLKTGYRYTDTRYWGVGIDSQEHTAFADFSHELTTKLSLSAGYSFTHSDAITEQYNTHSVYGGFTYQYADKASIYATLGSNWQKYNSGENVTFYSWNIGIVHDFDIVIATLATSSQTTADPLSVSTTTTSYSGKLDKVLKRGKIGLSTTYTEYTNELTGINSQRKLAFSGSGSYEVIPDLTPNLAVTAERYYINNGIDLPYHLFVSTGLSYAFNHDLTLSLTYTFDTKRNDPSSTTGEIEINRVIVEAKKTF